MSTQHKKTGDAPLVHMGGSRDAAVSELSNKLKSAVGGNSAASTGKSSKRGNVAGPGVSPENMSSPPEASPKKKSKNQPRAQLRFRPPAIQYRGTAASSIKGAGTVPVPKSTRAE